MTTALENNDMLVEDSCVNWWPDFIAFAESNASTAMTTFDGERIVGSTVFDQTFLNFYNDDAGSPYRNYLTVSNDVLELTEIPCRDDTARRDMTYRTEQMDRMREIAEICWSLGAVALGPAYWVQVSSRCLPPIFHLHWQPAQRQHTPEDLLLRSDCFPSDCVLRLP